MLIAAAVLFFAAAALLVLAFLAWTSRLPGNAVVGVRTPETRADEDVWQLANRAAAPLVAAAGVTVALVTAGMLVSDSTVWRVLVGVIGLGGALVLLGAGGSLGAKAAAGLAALRDTGDDACCGDSAGGEDAATCTDVAGGGCGETSPAAGAAADPSVDCGVAGGCGTCALNGMCESEPRA